MAMEPWARSPNEAQNGPYIAHVRSFQHETLEFSFIFGAPIVTTLFKGQGFAMGINDHRMPSSNAMLSKTPLNKLHDCQIDKVESIAKLLKVPILAGTAPTLQTIKLGMIIFKAQHCYQ